MQEAKLLKNKKLIMFAVYMAFIAVLFLGISTAKYTRSIKGYTNYGATSFNSVILGECPEDTINAFDRAFCIENCMPGMKFAEGDSNTAKIIPFSIANGVTLENASDSSVGYSLTIRTTRNIPLKYTLVQVTNSGTIEYETGEPVLMESDPSSGIEENKWYEWTFYNISDSAEGEATKKKASFSLAGGTLSVNNFELIVEWPIVNEGDNSTKYMKEVDLVEIYVEASSKNNIKDENDPIVYSDWDYYGDGIIILDPEKANDSNEASGITTCTYNYPVDLRSFHSIATEEGAATADKVYDFTVSNGAGIQVPQISINTEYTLELEVPYTVYDETYDANATEGFAYTLNIYNEKTKTYTAIAPVATEYRLYNVDATDTENFGTFKVVTEGELSSENLLKWTLEKSNERLYKVYKYSNAAFKLLNKAANSAGVYADRVAFNDLRIVMPEDSAKHIDEATAFDNKIQIIVKATATGGSGESQSAPTGGDGDVTGGAGE